MVNPIAVGLGAAALVFAAGSIAGRPPISSSGPRHRPHPTQGWADPTAPEQIRKLAWPVEKLTGMFGLGDFLSGVAYIESRGNPAAGSDANDNAARGWFGIRPQSAKLHERGMPPGILKNERAAVALAADYVYRLRPYAGAGQRLDWLAIRRGWGYPSDVDDIDHPGYHEQLAYGLAKAGVPSNFMFKPAFPAGFKWPGFEAVWKAAMQ